MKGTLRQSISVQVNRQWIWFRYFSKGMNRNIKIEAKDGGYQNIASIFKIFKFRSGGVLNCSKRIGTSQNISERKQVKSGFTSKLDYLL